MTMYFDARLSDLETELEQLAMDARRKDGVLGTHRCARITTEAMVAELPKKQGPAMPGGPGGGMGGMGGMDF